MRGGRSDIAAIKNDRNWSEKSVSARPRFAPCFGKPFEGMPLMEKNMTDDAATRKRRAGGRAGNKVRAGSSVIDQMPWRLPVNTDRPIEPMDDDGVQAIHRRGTMRILKDIGIEFLNPEAVAHLKKAGCKADGTNVRMSEDFVMEMLARAPETFTLTPRKRARADHGRQVHAVRQRVLAPNAWIWSVAKGLVISRLTRNSSS